MIQWLTRVETIEREPPPAALFSCPALPRPPESDGAGVAQGPLAAWIADLWGAGETCRCRLDAAGRALGALDASLPECAAEVEAVVEALRREPQT